MKSKPILCTIFFCTSAVVASSVRGILLFSGRFWKSEDFEKSEKSEEFEKSENSEDCDKSEKSEDFEKSEKSEDFEKSEKFEDFKKSEKSADAKIQKIIRKIRFKFVKKIVN